MNKPTLYGGIYVILSLALTTPVYSGGFIVHSSEGSEVIEVEDKDAVVISPENGKPHFMDESDKGRKMSKDSQSQQNEESMERSNEEAIKKAKEEREAEEAAKEAEAKKQSELNCYTVSEGGVVPGVHVGGGTVGPGGQTVGGIGIVFGGSFSGTKYYRICKDKDGKIVSKERL